MEKKKLLATKTLQPAINMIDKIVINQLNPLRKVNDLGLPKFLMFSAHDK
jgi:hypothetical protein